MKNEYRIEGDTTVIIVPYKKQIFETFIETADLPLMLSRAISWNIHDGRKASAGFRVIGRVKNEAGAVVKTGMHRFLLGFPIDMEVDHIDNDPLNNRRQNLRSATPQQNQQNRAGAMRNSKSGIRGVSWCKWGWRAQIAFLGKQKHLGWFKTADEAEVVVKAARAKYYPFSKEGMAAAKSTQEAA